MIRENNAISRILLPMEEDAIFLRESYGLGVSTAHLRIRLMTIQKPVMPSNKIATREMMIE